MYNDSKLISLAKSTANHAIARYSKFKVGAALETKNGSIFTGCNIESSSYGLTICAERVAFFKALSEGEREFNRLFLYTNTDNFCPPCGACRQVIWDFAPNLEIVLINKKDEQKTNTISELYPKAFGDNFFREKGKR